MSAAAERLKEIPGPAQSKGKPMDPGAKLAILENMRRAAFWLWAKSPRCERCNWPRDDPGSAYCDFCRSQLRPK